jgi:hypothetical protein
MILKSLSGTCLKYWNDMAYFCETNCLQGKFVEMVTSLWPKCKVSAPATPPPPNFEPTRFLKKKKKSYHSVNQDREDAVPGNLNRRSITSSV